MPYIFFIKIAIFQLLVSSSLKQISMKLHIFANFRMENLRMDPLFHFT